MAVSSSVSASRSEPSAPRTIAGSAAASYTTFSFWRMLSSVADIRSGAIGRKSKRCTRERIGGRELTGVGGGQHEDDVRRRLFQRLQQRIEGIAGELVHLVDDVDLVAAAGRRVLDVLAQRADVLDRRFEAASISMMSTLAAASAQAGHTPHGSALALRSGHSRARASSRAVVVLPIPRGPAKR